MRRKGRKERRGHEQAGLVTVSAAQIVPGPRGIALASREMSGLARYSFHVTESGAGIWRVQ